jgi:hypothetical protein
VEYLEANETQRDGEVAVTHSHGSNSLEVAGDLPPGAAPAFGAPLESPFEHTPERLVLSSEEHIRLVGFPTLDSLGGDFESDRFGSGSLTLSATGAPGEIHVIANVFRSGAPGVRMDANVRESWLARAVREGEAAGANARVVSELFRLAAIPRQSTVKVHVEAD